MKRLLPFIIVIILTSCAQKSSSEKVNSNNLKFTVEIDTVQVDPGDEHFIYLTNYLNTAAVSSDKKTLYNFNARVPELEVIDLDSLSLKEVIKLENEGPTGIDAVNSYIPMMDISDNGDLYLNAWNYLIKLNSARDQVSKYWFTPDSLKGEPLLELEKVFPEGFMSEDGDFFYSSYGLLNNKGPKSGLAIINLRTRELKKIPLDLYERIEDLSIVFSPNENSKISLTEGVLFLPYKNKIIASTTAFNEIYLIDLTDGSIEKRQFQSTLTADAKKGDYQKKANSEEELSELNLGRMKEVNFHKLHFDDQNEKFWRFSSELDRMIGDSAAFKYVLTIFDKDLNQLHEEKVDYSETGSLTFFKDGTLYSYINLEDELGFIRIKPSYE
ncbi:DUF4221 family protein [Algoriphagus resistens]|uniref:DUF4221 family protein n=1 Tax=Algoriphagus resistens TaxID=1750590 RepID=UPI0007167B3A|nr:DUF4221 family protein [Algoriphagus resistens]